MPLRETRLFCHKKDGKYRNFYPNEFCVKMCGVADPIVEVVVTESALLVPSSVGYWAWWDNERGSFSMVYETRTVLSICFPYGIEAEEERGKGVALPVTVVEVA